MVGTYLEYGISRTQYVLSKVRIDRTSKNIYFRFFKRRVLCKQDRDVGLFVGKNGWASRSDRTEQTLPVQWYLSILYSCDVYAAINQVFIVPSPKSLFNKYIAGPKTRRSLWNATWNHIFIVPGHRRFLFIFLSFLSFNPICIRIGNRFTAHAYNILNNKNCVSHTFITAATVSGVDVVPTL